MNQGEHRECGCFWYERRAGSSGKRVQHCSRHFVRAIVWVCFPVCSPFREASSRTSSSRSPETSYSKSSDRMFGVSYDASWGGSGFHLRLLDLPSLRLHVPVWRCYDRARHRKGLFRALGNALPTGTVRRQCLSWLRLSHLYVSLRLAMDGTPIEVPNRWYKRDEAQKRSTFFFSATSLAGAFGGLLATAIGKMGGVAGYSSWRWIFIIGGFVF